MSGEANVVLPSRRQTERGSREDGVVEAEDFWRGSGRKKKLADDGSKLDSRVGGRTMNETLVAAPCGSERADQSQEEHRDGRIEEKPR
jgi:hypothetical protein